MFSATWSILCESAVYILAGFVIAGLLEGWLSSERILRSLGAKTAGSVLLATLIGAPLPLCSCSVLPAAVTLRKKGASKGAALAFLISTPETSATSVILTYSLLGPFVAIFRPIATCVTAITAGLIENFLDRRFPSPSRADAESVVGARCHAAPAPPVESCCHGSGEAAVDPHPSPSPRKGEGLNNACEGQGFSKTRGEEGPSDACNGEGSRKARPISLRVRAAMRYAFVTLFDDLFGWILLGIVAAGMIQAWLPPDTLRQVLGGPLQSMVLMALIGVPMYVCAESSTPIAAALIMQGMNPGAALVFLLVGPATNIGSLGILCRQLGGRTITVYLSVIIIMAMLMGGLLNLLLQGVQVDLAGHVMCEPLVPQPLKVAGASAFLLLGVASVARSRMVRRFGGLAGS